MHDAAAAAAEMCHKKRFKERGLWRNLLWGTVPLGLHPEEKMTRQDKTMFPSELIKKHCSEGVIQQKHVGNLGAH